MSDFKKLPCATNCPTPTGLIDCDGAPINVGDALARCSDIPQPGDTVAVTNTVAGNRIATVTINGVPTDIRETLTTLESVTFDEATRTLSVTYKGEDGVSVTKQENIPAIDAVVHIGPDVITPPTKYPQYYNTIVSDGNGNFWAFSIDGTPTPLNFIETITTLVDVLTYANKHEIFKYKNESGALTPAYETVTTLKSLSYAKSTNILTVVYTDENGTDITKTAEIKDLTNVFINGANPNSATIFSTTTPPSVNDNTLKQGTDYIYVGTDGSYWIWNGTAYVTAPVPAATTEWNVAGTNVDAKGDKVNRISRSGWVAIGRNIVPGVALEVQPTGTNQYYPLARFTNPDNKIVGNHTQLIFGVEQAAYNCSDWRFYYAGNNSTSNRIDFGMSGLVPPVISYNGNGNTGFNMTSPLSRADVNGSFGFAIRGSGGSATQGPQDGTVVFTVASSVYTLEAPSAATNVRRFITVKNASTGNITVSGHIDGVAATQLIIGAGGGAIFHSNGNSWWRVADNEQADTTEWRLSGTTVDAKGDKTTRVWRNAGIAVGASLTAANSGLRTALFSGYDNFQVQPRHFEFRDSRFSETDGVGFNVSNVTGIATDYYPAFSATPAGTTTSMLFVANSRVVEDWSGASTLMRFRVQRNTGAPIQQRLAYMWENYTTPLMYLDISGRVSPVGGVALPQMSTAAINALVSPPNGLMVYNLTIHSVVFRQNGAWVKPTVTPM